MCERCHGQQDRDAKFWRTVRRALLMVAGAISERYPEKKRGDRRAA